MLKTLRNAPFALLILVASFLCPTELSVEIQGLRLPPHRIAILLIFPLALLRILVRSDTRVRSFDIVFLLYAVWTLVTYHYHGPDHGSLVYGGSIALESFGAYVIARAYVRSYEDFRATLDLLLAAVVVSLIFALPEMLLGKHFVHDYLQAVTGFEHPRRIEHRLGLTRAYGTFDHPIHLGTFAATILALVWFGGRRLSRRIKACALVVMTTFTALSSAPILCALIQIAGIVWDRATRGLKGRVWITFVGIALVYIVVSVFANRSPLMIIATSLTIDSWTGYYRTQIWYHGLQNVFANPWLGIGLADWDRAWWMISDSIDSYWLVIAVRQGVPALLVLLTAIAVLLTAMATRPFRVPDRPYTPCAKAWLMSLLALALVGCTVHFWNVSHAYFFFFLGLGGWLADPLRARQRARATQRTQRKRRGKRVNALTGIPAKSGRPVTPAPAVPSPA